MYLDKDKVVKDKALCGKDANDEAKCDSVRGAICIPNLMFVPHTLETNTLSSQQPVNYCRVCTVLQNVTLRMS